MTLEELEAEIVADVEKQQTCPCAECEQRRREIDLFCGLRFEQRVVYVGELERQVRARIIH